MHPQLLPGRCKSAGSHMRSQQVHIQPSCMARPPHPLHSILNHHLLQNFCYPYLGVRRHQRPVQVKQTRCCPPLQTFCAFVPRSSAHLSIAQRLECSGKSELGVFRNQPGAAIDCVLFADFNVQFARRMMPATSAAAPSPQQL